MPRRAFFPSSQSRVLQGFAVAVALACLSGVAAAQNPLLGPGAVKKSPLRGSTISVTNAVTLNTIDRDADLTYNPTYAVSTSAAMRYWVTDNINLRLGFGFSREITNNDFTTQRDELLLDDTTLGVGAMLWNIPVVDVLAIGAFDLRFPTGPFSQAQTMIVAAQPRAIFYKQFEPLGFNLTFVTGFNRMFNEYFTESAAGPYEICPSVALGCDPTDTGVRNVKLRLINAFAVGIFPAPWYGASASVTVLHDYLYPRSEGRVSNERGADVTELSATFVPQEEQNTRTLMAYNLEAFVLPHQSITLAVGASTFGPQRAPDSSNYAPFINRFTNLVVDVRINVAAAIALVED